ncbi:hypothetical protein MRX96_044693 [Rhipicephalus microplus]
MHVRAVEARKSARAEADPGAELGRVAIAGRACLPFSLGRAHEIGAITAAEIVAGRGEECSPAGAKVGQPVSEDEKKKLEGGKERKAGRKSRDFSFRAAREGCVERGTEP